MASFVRWERRVFVTASVCMAALVACVAPAAAQKDNAYVQTQPGVRHNVDPGGSPTTCS